VRAACGRAACGDRARILAAGFGSGGKEAEIMPSLESISATAGLFGAGMPGTPEVIIMLVIVLLIFGPKKLPALSRAIGKSITDFKKGLHDIKGDIEKADVETEPKAGSTKKSATPAEKNDGASD
jgi:sec-independent protein translocase protein TatA